MNEVSDRSEIRNHDVRYCVVINIDSLNKQTALEPINFSREIFLHTAALSMSVFLLFLHLADK
jgi:hypothetical protein